MITLSKDEINRLTMLGQLLGVGWRQALTLVIEKASEHFADEIREKNEAMLATRQQKWDKLQQQSKIAGAATGTRARGRSGGGKPGTQPSAARREARRRSRTADLEAARIALGGGPKPALAESPSSIDAPSSSAPSSAEPPIPPVTLSSSTRRSSRSRPAPVEHDNGETE